MFHEKRRKIQREIKTKIFVSVSEKTGRQRWLDLSFAVFSGNGEQRQAEEVNCDFDAIVEVFSPETSALRLLWRDA
jgi:hypothetical protein